MILHCLTRLFGLTSALWIEPRDPRRRPVFGALTKCVFLVRIPDRFEEGKLVGEIKNVDKLYKTAQMSDLLDIAKANNVPLTLWTDTRTELSKSLQDLINRGEIIHFRRPFPNRFQGGMW